VENSLDFGATRGSHRHPGDDVHPDTLKSVLKQAGLKGKP
jgi:predicted RNA binding protein YcfA (HicA-like mRNA interferase family)